jgi:hypothetical protein
MGSVKEFLAEKRFAVVGASNERSKFGNKVLRCYLQDHRDAVPVHPKEPVVEGQTAYKSLGEIPGGVGAVSIITPPKVTEAVVEEAGRLGERRRRHNHDAVVGVPARAKSLYSLGRRCRCSGTAPSPFRERRTSRGRSSGRSGSTSASTGSSPSPPSRSSSR